MSGEVAGQNTPVEVDGTEPSSTGVAREAAGYVGLTEQQAQARLAESGWNEPVQTARRSILFQLGSRLASPLVAILILSSIASAFLGDLVNAILILAIVVVSIAVESFQTHRSERAADALKAQVAQVATVMRDARWREIARRDLVPGDLIRLSAGDMVPADAVLVESRDLHVNEAALTGESLPAEKTPPERLGRATEPDAAHVVFMGSSVVSGHATATVIATGPRTNFGQVASQLSRRAPPTEFERGIARFGFFIMKTVLFLVLFTFAVTAVLRRDPFGALLFAVALAVGLTPEFLPMITTVTLTRGAVRMASRKVIVKNLSAIQDFGSIDVLCCDKTGTLTTGEMTLEGHVDPFGQLSNRPLLLAYVNSYFESGVENPVDAAVLRKARIDPLDSAVLKHEHPDISGFAKVDEIPFDFERRRVSVVAQRRDELLLVTKGAPEHVVSIANAYEADGRTAPLDEKSRAEAVATCERLGAAGHRVLAVAYKTLAPDTRFSVADERDMILAGFISFLDPPREDALEVLAALRAEGVEVKVLTGDSDLVAGTICRCVGVPTERMLLGRDLDKLSEPALIHRAQRTSVFARVSPAQKNRILRALKASGHVVGFLGDGINDAPSLHAADFGISVAGAVDVAKEAAEVILLEPGLRVLLDGIVEGRKAFGNVMKYLIMGTSSNFGNMFSMAIATVMLPFLPMLPSQILLNNFLYDMAQISIPSDNVDQELVRKPRRWSIDEIRRYMLWIGPVSSLYDILTFYVLLKVFHASEPLFHSGWFVESLATQTLVIFVIRTAGNPLQSRPSRALTMSTIVVVLAGAFLPFSPVAGLLGFTPLPWAFVGFLVAATATYLLLVELAKRQLRKRVLPAS